MVCVSPRQANPAVVRFVLVLVLLLIILVLLLVVYIAYSVGNATQAVTFPEFALFVGAFSARGTSE